MKQKTRWHDALVLAAVLCAAFLIVTGTQQITGRIDGVASMVFVLAVFLISIYTDGYVLGVVASLISVLASLGLLVVEYGKKIQVKPNGRKTCSRAWRCWWCPL